MARNALTNLWSGDGRLRREPYVAAFLLLFGLMYGTHALAAALLFGRGWWPTDYINPDHFINLADFDERLFLGTLALFAAPYVWMMVSLTAHVAAGVLADVVRRDHPPHPRPGARPRQIAF